MIGDKVIVDAVVHPYDLAPSNQITCAKEQLEAVYAAHRMASDARHQQFVLQHDEFFTDFSFEAIARLEHQVKDLGVDGLKLYPAFFYDGIGQGWRLDGDAFATPLLEAAIEMGIKQ